MRITGQFYREGRPVAQLAHDADGAAEGVEDAVHDVQAQAQAAVVAGVSLPGHGPLEAYEDALQAVGRDADAVVAHRQPRGIRVRLPRDLYRPAAPVLSRVRAGVGRPPGAPG